MIKQNKSLVLFGEATTFFTDNYRCLKNARLKFLIIQEKDSEEVRLFLMVRKEGFLHAQALLSYMQYAGLDKITVYGGGKLDIDQIGESWLIQAMGKSYGFKVSDKFQTRELLEKNWPEAESIVDGLNNLELKDVAYHRLYTLAQVKLEADD